MSVVCFGELLIDFVALESGITVGEASGFQKAPGGAPANVAVAVARLGGKSAFLGQVGDDPFGHHLADVLRQDKVDVSGLRFSAEARTALAFVALGEGGERTFSFYRNPSADMLMQPKDVKTDVIDQHDIFHFGSITMIHEPSRSATLHAVEYAQQQGKLISYDPNLRAALWENLPAAKHGMMHGFQYANIVKISDEELEFLTDDKDVNSLWHDATKMIIVTHGAHGSTAYTKEQSFHHGGYRVDSVDTTGAGDSFIAGVLSKIVEYGDDYLENMNAILAFANAVGAITTIQKGAIPALPTQQQVQDFLPK